MSNRSKQVLIIAALVVAFFALRLPGIHIPYYQDEWKNVSAASTVAGAGSFFAHPPFMQMLFVLAYDIFGTNDFRSFPLVFALATAILIYFVVRDRYGKMAAIWSVALFCVSYYSILGSLMPDMDGSVLPFLFLLSVFAYDKMNASLGIDRWRWFILLVLALLAGFLVKLAFILVVATIVIHYLLRQNKQTFWKSFLIAAGYSAAFGIVYVGLLYLIQAIYPAFSISFMLGHANQFADAGGRVWTQIFVQGLKSLYYLSPIMLVPIIFIDRETFKKTRLMWIYLAVSFLFYYVIFDFSKAVLDKYTMFAIVPIAVITGLILSKILEKRTPAFKWAILAGVAISVLLVALNFVPQAVVGLYPKTAWFSRVLHGHWNVLTPLNGGSGPMGFYVSFLFIAASYIVSIGVAAVGFFRKQWRAPAAIILVVIGIAYNLVFAEEYFFGGINGSATIVLNDAVSFIAKTDSIKQVLTYNDIGAGPLSLMGKYAGRIYATPESESSYRAKFIAFDGDYLVVDMPILYDGFYSRFFAQCKVLYESDSKDVSGIVYQCPHDAKTVNSL